MLLYAIVILISVAVISIINIIFSCPVYGLEWWFPIGYVVFSTLAVIAVDGIVALISRALPKGLFNPTRKRFKIFKWEKRFAEILGVKKWKDKIPELGRAFVGFRKDTVGDIRNNEHVLLFMKETCYAEIIHFYSLFFGFLIMLIYPIKFSLIFALPVAVVNAILNLLPIIVQRYTRPKLIKLYGRNQREENLEMSA